MACDTMRVPDVTVSMEELRLLILFGSQTGNSQDVAEKIGRDAKRRRLMPRIQAMDAYDVPNLPQEKAVVFVASTTGQGETPSNMKTFWRFLLRKSLPANSLSSTCYAVFGLGDSGYVNYNTVAKRLDRRLAALGAREILPRGLGDDQHPLGYEATLDPWLKDFWEQLHFLYPNVIGLSTSDNLDSGQFLDTPKFKLTILPPQEGDPAANGASDEQLEAVAAAHAFGRLEAISAGIGQQHDTLAEPLTYPDSEWGPANPCMATLVTNQRITAPDHFQDTRHIEFNIGRNSPAYQPGDILSIFPHQSQKVVLQLLKRLDIEASRRVKVELQELPADFGHTSMEIGVQALIQGALDIDSASPRRYFFEVLQRFAGEQLQRERLEHFASAEGREDLALYNQNEGRTVLEVLRDFSSVKLPLEWLLQTCPRLQPRQFSIASSLNAHPAEAHITLAIVDYRTPFKRRKRGLCSSWLASLQPGGKVPVWAERGVLHLPNNLAKPLVLIGPGTGIAPFRAFLEERELQQNTGLSIAPCYLYFGCRNAAKDFYYESQLQALQAKGVLARDCGLVTAFSRDQPQKVYVTNRLAENAALLSQLLEQGAHVYICGSADKMPQQVADIFREQVLQAHLGLSSAEAQKHLVHLQTSGRYSVEAWS